MKIRVSRSDSTLVGCVRGAVLLGVIGLVSGCASTGKHVQGWDKVVLSPGDTGNCNSSPCMVYLKMPPGQGSYEVTGNEVRIGTYPAGQTAFLGSFWSSQGIQIKGMNVPQTYVYIPVQR
jgi:hypothetical protein